MSINDREEHFVLNRYFFYIIPIAFISCQNRMVLAVVTLLTSCFSEKMGAHLWLKRADPFSRGARRRQRA